MAVAASVLVMGQMLRPLMEADLDHVLNHLEPLALVVGCLAFASFGRSFSFSLMAERMVAHIKWDAFGALVYAPVAQSDFVGHAELLRRFHQDQDVLRHFISQSFGVLIRNTFMFVGALAFLFKTTWTLTLFTLVAIACICLPILLLVRLYRGRLHESYVQESHMNQFLNEMIQSLRVVQANLYERAGLLRYQRFLGHFLRSTQRRLFVRALLSSTIIALVALSLLGILALGFHWLNGGLLTAGQLASFLFYAILVGATGSAMSEIMADWQKASRSLERMLQMVSLKPHQAKNQKALPKDVRGIVALNHVSFAYPQNPEDKVLEDITFSAAPGEMVAIVGPSGAGKSSIFSLLLGFYTPQEGQIFLEGVDQRRVDPQRWRQYFSYVPQESVVFTDTVYQNLTFGHDVPEIQVWDVLSQVGLRELVKSLPQGLNTILGEEHPLSVGEKQRLSIARALLRKAPVLLLDEITSALDAFSEKLVQEALSRASQHATTLVVAHRLATVLRANRIVVLNHGKIDDIGTHAELMVSSALYQKLVTQEFVDLPQSLTQSSLV